MEIAIVCSILLGRYNAVFTAIILATFALYGLALIVGSERLRVHQRRANHAASEAMGKAVDSMLNYETVKYFGNETHVARRYDTALADVERLTIKSYSFLSYTGIVQMTVIGAGMTLLVVMAAMRVESGTMTVGDFVLVNTYLLQFIRPIERLGQLYRGIKQAPSTNRHSTGLHAGLTGNAHETGRKYHQVCRHQRRVVLSRCDREEPARLRFHTQT